MEDIGSSEASLYWRYWDLNPFRFSLLPYSACSHQGRTLLWARMQRNQLTLGWKLWSCEPSKSVILLSWFIPGVCYTDKKLSTILSSDRFCGKPRRTHSDCLLPVWCICPSSNIKLHQAHLPNPSSNCLLFSIYAAPKWLPLSHETALPQISPSPAHLIH